MSALYAKSGKIFCNQYTEIYVPMEYFNNGIAINKGVLVETFGSLYIRCFPDGKAEPIKFFNAPVIVNIMLYEYKYETIKIHDRNLDVMTLQFMKDSQIMHQSITKGREVAEHFLEMVLAGKLPKTLNYLQLINLWWTNLWMSGVSFKIPSKEYEMILAYIYRNPKNPKERYGQYYGKSPTSDGYDYKTGNVRSVVKDLSTFSGMVFEDMNSMISSGIRNSINDVEEPVSPLEKIIHY